VKQQFYDYAGGRTGRITLQSASSKCNDKNKLEIRVVMCMYWTIIY
jgi:hypothetical protein